MLYARVQAGVILDYEEFVKAIDDQSKLAASKPRLLPVVVENETYNAVTQAREGPAIIIEATRVVRRFTIRAKTAEEIAQMKQDLLQSVQREELRRIAAVMNDGEQFALMVLGFMGMIGSGSLDRATWNAQVRAAFNPLYDTARTTLIALHTASVTKQAEVSALTDPIAINAYDVTTGWA